MKPTLPVLIAIAAIQSSGAVEFRTIDGSGNNLANPDYGQAGTELLRISSANYGDGIGAVDGSRVNPRLVSNAVFDQPGSIPDARGLSEWVWVWGQFIDHDMDHTLTGGGNGTLQIEVPTNDPYFGDLSPNNFINVTRSDFTGGLATARAQISNITPWLDAGNVYGGRASDIAMGNERQDWLRTMDGTGRLKTTDGGAVGDLLPKWDAGAPGMANTNVPTMGANAYVAGDVRANEHVALLTTHTVFVREHNRLAGIIAANNPGMGGDEIYDRARKIVGAEIQAITYNEFLPAIGVVLPTYGGYDNTLNPAVANEFSTAAFRMGHSQVNGTMLRLNEDGSPIAQGNLNLADSFFQPGKLAAEGGLEPVIRGLAAQVQEETDAKIADGLRNQLFQTFDPAAGLIDNATDLAAMNIMRGRDHGLDFYNNVREAYGLARVSGFGDITSDVDTQAALASVYSSVDDIDLWVGILAEDHLADAALGETGIVILTDQFERLRDADRFWFQNGAGGINDDLLDIALWDGANGTSASEWLDGVTLADILLLNTGVDSIQQNVFFAEARPVPEPGAAALLALVAAGFTFRRRRAV